MRVAKAKVILAACAMLLVFGGRASAQYPDQIGAGMSFTERDGTATGVTVDYAHPIVPFIKGPLAVLGEFGLNSAEGTTLTSYLGGVRFRWDLTRRVAPFGQFLAGAEHCCGATNVALQPGFGVEIAVMAWMSVRAQVDFRDVWLEGDDVGGKRYTFGVALPFRGRR